MRRYGIRMDLQLSCVLLECGGRPQETQFLKTLHRGRVLFTRAVAALPAGEAVFPGEHTFQRGQISTGRVERVLSRRVTVD